MDAAATGSLLKNLSLLCVLLKEFAEARQYLTQCLQLLPLNPTVWFRYAEVCRLEAASALRTTAGYSLRDKMAVAREEAPAPSASYLQRSRWAMVRRLTRREALLGYQTAVQLYAERGEVTTLLVACRLQTARLHLGSAAGVVCCVEARRYEDCLAECAAVQTAVASVETLGEEEVPLSKEDALAMAALYASECYYATQRLAVGVVRWSDWGSWLSTPFRRLHIPSCILPSWRRWRRIRAHCRNTARRWIK